MPMGAPEKDMREIFNLLTTAHTKIAHREGSMSAFLMPNSSKNRTDSAARFLVDPSRALFQMPV
eukprot:4860245-Amphidinium_carterae.3